jgi:hypothetical protein
MGRKVQEFVPAEKHNRNSFGTISRETLARANESERTESRERRTWIKRVKDDKIKQSNERAGWQIGRQSDQTGKEQGIFGVTNKNLSGGNKGGKKGERVAQR